MITLLVLVLLSIAIVNADQVADVCKLNDKKACSAHGTCASYVRNDKTKGTRCICTYPYVGEKCQVKRFEAAPRFQLDKHRHEKIESSSSSSSSSSDSESESETEVETETETETSERSDRSDDSESERSDSDESDWSDEDRRHAVHSNWTGWLFGGLLLICLCCILPAILWCVWPKRCATTTHC